MIFHISIPAQDPQGVATVLAELLQGRVTPFAGHAGAWMAWSGRHEGHLIEVMPAGENTLKTEGAYGAVHIALAVDLAADEVVAIGEREGWRVRHCRRGDSFDVIELWIEDHFLVEVLTPEMQAEYLASCRA